jgi:hypothetical protein
MIKSWDEVEWLRREIYASDHSLVCDAVGYCCL